MMPKTIQTMAWAYQQICAGEDPWTALGNFKNAWYDYAKDMRAALVSEPLGKPEPAAAHTRHWGAFCAASVEFLCDRYGVLAQSGSMNLAIRSPPPGTGTTSSILPTPWCSSIALKLPQLHLRSGMSFAATGSFRISMKCMSGYRKRALKE